MLLNVMAAIIFRMRLCSHFGVEHIVNCLSTSVRVWVRVRDSSGVQSFVVVPANPWGGIVSDYPWGARDLGDRLVMYVS